MSSYTEETYWITLANLPRWGSEKINRLIIKIHQSGASPADFFELAENEWKLKYDLDEKETADLRNSRNNFPANSFLAETLISQGFEMIPLTSKDYSPILKNNLKTKYSPPLLYIKGNRQILQEDSAAIVGSREASEISLKFTDNIARIASEKFKVIVSGFAKGIDKQALDSALKYNGQSIIVLPQGILTFESGINKYYRQIIEGNALVLSIFHPQAVWSAGLAMARNPVIYGLAKEIYVAQSSDSGGTWEGVKTGLKMGRKIYVRMPEPDEKNANLLLIEAGSVPVDFNGNEVASAGAEKDNKYCPEVNDIDLVVDVLKNSSKPLTAKSISELLNNKISPGKIRKLLKEFPGITKTKISPAEYSFGEDQGSLF